VSATHRDLEEAVRAGDFREDLYYRLAVVQVELPPLRERLEDLDALCHRFLTQVAERLERQTKRLDASALARLSRHHWPGNVRELRNVLERAAVLAAGDEIREADVQLGSLKEEPADVAPDLEMPFSEAKRQTVERFERSYLEGALREHEGNVSRTANAIGMVRQSLQQKIRELGIKVDEFRRRG
jgi:DNA-binding NtrC family response regulator